MSIKAIAAVVILALLSAGAFVLASHDGQSTDAGAAPNSPRRVVAERPPVSEQSREAARRLLFGVLMHARGGDVVLAQQAPAKAPRREQNGQ